MYGGVGALGRATRTSIAMASSLPMRWRYQTPLRFSVPRAPRESYRWRPVLGCGTVAWFRFGAVLDYKGGYRIFNDYAFTAAGSSNLPEQNLLGSPEWLQARTIAQSAAGFPSSFFEDGTFLRFRELSLTYTVPRSWLRTLHVRTLGITGAVRNLALWTRYTGTDPETSSRARPTTRSLMSTR